MIKVLTKYDIDEILDQPQDYINEREEIDLLQVGDNILKLGCWAHPYYYLSVDYQSEFSVYAPDTGETLADLYSKVVCKLNDSVDVSKMSYSEFTVYLSEDFLDRFSLIIDCDDLDCDNFSVYKDNATGKFYYLESGINDASEFFEVYPVAVLHYTIMHDIKIKDGEELSKLFDCYVCGEEVADDEIRYWWFARKDGNL